MTANFKYDGDTGFAGASSKRVRATINGGLDTVFIGNYFEWNVTTQTKRTYYFAGATRTAIRDNSGTPHGSWATTPASPVQALGSTSQS